jgi:hypothetical protein
MRFILTIDTEADNQWDHGRDLTVENLKYIPRFQDLFDKYQITPTYLVTSEICEDAFAREIFKDYLSSDRAEIGAHLHSWTTPPFLEKDGYRRNDKNHAFAHELTDDLFTEKLKNLTSLIETSFGERPLSFRSGRYGFNRNIARILAENLYLVDSSVTPYTSWASFKGIPGGDGGSDFLDKLSFPYMYDFNINSILEIPVTILPSRFPLNRSRIISGHYFRIVDNYLILRALRRLLFRHQPLWLRPFPYMNLGLFDEIINEAIRIKLPYLVMMFHSSELMPGGSIYRADRGDVEKLYELLESFFITLHELKIDSVSLTGAAKSYKA